MHNPASDLIAIFDSWESRGGAASNQVLANTSDGWNQVARGFHLLEEIEAALKEMSRQGKNVTVFLGALRHWRTSLINFNRSWRQETIQLEKQDLLHALVPLMQSDPVASLKDFDENDLRSNLESFAQALLNDVSIDAALRQYVLKLVAHINFLLDLGRAGNEFELSTSLAQLKFCFDAAAQQSEEESQGSKYRQAARWIRDSVIGPVIASVTLSIAQAHIPEIGN